METEVPMCTVCSHPHHPEDRCKVCGHRGKGKTYRLLTDGPPSQGLHFDFFDTRTPQNEYTGKWKFCEIIRRRIFVEEGGLPEAFEFDEYDAPSRHALIMIGDAPVGCGRWR
eukprot:CAMPEP_0206361198 /NCGR_PEP_ID=MMETSP0294-20121207/202_1 /ASSEMBLY_ACC=CAM_ASM_000327 /TAXON_ID=39354 /ORGANISM="Heterosigma akashiwo, Strain CCMP2393" /LENGTH=111 /DNA_ID=CAMNT_0053806003 /DNA_START=101 /DNA_END=433 /DNA_ORIENTATION=+